MKKKTPCLTIEFSNSKLHTIKLIYLHTLFFIWPRTHKSGALDSSVYKWLRSKHSLQTGFQFITGLSFTVDWTGTMRNKVFHSKTQCTIPVQGLKPKFCDYEFNTLTTTPQWINTLRNSIDANKVINSAFGLVLLVLFLHFYTEPL